MNRKANILLIFPECRTKIFGGNGSGAAREKAISPPLGLLYLAAELSAAGYGVTACDYNAEDYSEQDLSVKIRNADLVGLSLLSFNLNHAQCVIAAINRMRPELPIILGGPDCILHPRTIPGTRLTVCHEAEDIIVEVVDAVLNGQDLSEVPGILFTGAAGRTRSGKPYRYNRCLDTLRFPRRELLRSNKGYSVIGRRRSAKVTTIITSRGCPKRCIFCAHGAIAYGTYRRRSSRNVLDEIELIARQGYEIVGIVDDNFTADKKRATEILHGIIDMRPKIVFVVQGRVDAADAELFGLMKKAGVIFVTFGLESGCQDVLDFYRKEITVDQARSAVNLADKAGMYTGGIFMLGAPFETKRHFAATYRFAAGLPLDVTTFWTLDYTYGSLLWENARDRNLIRADEHNVPAGRERGTSPYPTREIEAVARRCFFRFYLRPAYWARQLVKLVRIREKYFLFVLLAGICWLAGKLNPKTFLAGLHPLKDACRSRSGI
jgi:anaerobic magnesium-protoporphyrin IX monomethyl ester cyclase